MMTLSCKNAAVKIPLNLRNLGHVEIPKTLSVKCDKDNYYNEFKFKLVLRWVYSSLHAFSIHGSAHITFPLINELGNRTLKLSLALF